MLSRKRKPSHLDKISLLGKTIAREVWRVTGCSDGLVPTPDLLAWARIAREFGLLEDRRDGVVDHDRFNSDEMAAIVDGYRGEIADLAAMVIAEANGDLAAGLERALVRTALDRDALNEKMEHHLAAIAALESALPASLNEVRQSKRGGRDVTA